MINYLRFLSSTKDAFDILSSKEEVDEKRLDGALFGLMYPNAIENSLGFPSVGGIRQQVADYYKHYAPNDLGFDTRQKKTRRKTIDILDELTKYGCSDLLSFNLRTYSDVNQILRNNCLPIERRLAELRDIQGFDFDIYRLTKSVSKLSELNDIKGYSTKRILLEYYLTKFMDEVFEGIIDALRQTDIIDGENYEFKSLPNQYSATISKIRSICVNEKTKEKLISTKDKQELLRPYCKFPSEINLNILTKILEEVKDWYEIPYACDKKKFAAIVYNLYRCQSNIGMRTNAFNTYTNFKRVMCSYFDMPESTYKVNDIESISKILMRDLCFKDFELDAKWLTINGNEKKRKKRK